MQGRGFLWCRIWFRVHRCPFRGGVSGVLLVKVSVVQASYGVGFMQYSSRVLDFRGFRVQWLPEP